jgi:hypothetical protein
VLGRTLYRSHELESAWATRHPRRRAPRSSSLVAAAKARLGSESPELARSEKSVELGLHFALLLRGLRVLLAVGALRVSLSALLGSRRSVALDGSTGDGSLTGTRQLPSGLRPWREDPREARLKTVRTALGTSGFLRSLLGQPTGPLSTSLVPTSRATTPDWSYSPHRSDTQTRPHFINPRTLLGRVMLGGPHQDRTAAVER